MKKSVSLTLVMSGLLLACSAPKEKPMADFVKLNQVGYYPNQEKVAVVDNQEVEAFVIRNAADGKEVLNGAPKSSAVCSWSGKKRTTLDFSQLTTPGKYLLEVNGAAMPFEINERALSSLADAALKAFYYQRVSMPIEEKYAGKWNRPAGHPDDEVMVHPNAASAKRPAGTIISSPKGWYDAGDYNKYIVNSGFTIGLMQAVYQLFPDYFAKQTVNIPESGNATPDLLDEIYYNIDWMLTMQDPADGGVYHKLTTPSFEGFVKPIDCKQQRYVVFKSVTAALDFAATMAQSAPLFAAYEKDYPGFAEKALKAAEAAYAWAKKHPKAYYEQHILNQKFEPAVNTGTYGDGNATDEFFWAATELYFLTGEKCYRADVETYSPASFTQPTWPNVAALGVFSWLQPSRKLNEEDAAYAAKLKDMLIAYCDQLIVAADTNGFHAPFGDEASEFHWGCLSEGSCNQAISLIFAYLNTNNEKYLTNAYRNSDYILGRNATGYCYVTGFGQTSPKFPHHRLAGSDGIEEPLPGFLVGGPNPGQSDKGGQVVYPSDFPDESWADVEGSYASNEIAINWNASLVALMGALDALAK